MKKKNKPILLKDFIFGIIEYPIFLIVGGFLNSLVDILISPLYLSYLRIRGINIFKNIDPSWNFQQIKNYSLESGGEEWKNLKRGEKK